MVNRIYLIILILLPIIGCDYENPVDYNIVNQSDRKLKVIFNQWDNNNGMYITKDSLVYVSSKEKKTLIIRPILGSSVWNPEYGNDTIWALNKLLVYKSDSVLITKNFRLMTKWEYRNLSRHHSELNLYITNQDLE